MQASTNYIYIIFAVAYAIYSMVKAGKKVTQNRPNIDKQPEQNPTVQPPTSTPLPQYDYKKVMEDLLGGAPEEEKTTPSPLPVERGTRGEAKPQPTKISLHTPQKERTITAKEKLSAAKSKITADKPLQAKHPQTARKAFVESFVEEPTADFDIRQAIIYSEILKRPEY